MNRFCCAYWQALCQVPVSVAAQDVSDPTERVKHESEEAPLEFRVAVMRNKALDLPIRLHAAVAAAPYLHPKLTMVDARVGFAAEVSRAKLREMTVDEFDLLVLGADVVAEPEEVPP